MARYVDIDKIDCTRLEAQTAYGIKLELDALPVEKIPMQATGCWIILEAGAGWCSHCGTDTPMGGDIKSQTKENAAHYKYCPVCGSKMVGVSIR